MRGRPLFADSQCARIDLPGQVDETCEEQGDANGQEPADDRQERAAGRDPENEEDHGCTARTAGEDGRQRREETGRGTESTRLRLSDR